MAQSYVTFTGNGSSTGPITLGYNYILKSHVKVYQTRDILANTGTLLSETTHYTFNTAGTQISMVTAPANGVVITIERQTPNDDQIVPYADGSNLIADSLNNSDKQTLFCTQELEDRQELSAAKAEAARVSAATATTNVSNLTTTQFNKDGSDTLSGNLTVTGTVDGRDVAADGTKLDTIESGATADQTNAEIRAAVEAASDSNVFTDADHTKLNAIEANATQDQTASEIRALVESATDSNVFTDADHTKLNAIESGATGDQSNAEIRAAVEAASDSNVFTDADHTKLNNAATLTDGQTLTNKTLTSPVINDMSGTAVVTSGTSTSDNKTYSAKRAGEIFYGKDTVGEIQSGETWSAGDDKVATTAAIDARITDLVDDVGGFVPIANETSFPNANPDVNNGAGTLVSIKALSSNITSDGSGVATIANGTVGNSTVTINGLANSTTYASTFGMIVETTTTLNTYTFHRLVPKATEVTTVSGSISNVNTVAGAISNVNAVAGNATNINAVAGNNSNITSVAGNASNINSAVSNATNINSVVSNASNINTTAGSISNVNLVGGSISNVNQVASNLSGVNAFGERYSFGASNPTSDLDTGDLFFNTSANELKVYNGSAWQGGVTASGNFASVTGNTFTGNNIYNDSVKALFGTGNDLEIYHNGTDSEIKGNTGSLTIKNANNLNLYTATNEDAIVAVANAEVSLWYNGSKKFETTSAGVIITGNAVASSKFRGNDNVKLSLGDAEDLQIYHSSDNNSYITEGGSGALVIKADDLYLQNAAGSHTNILADSDGRVELAFNGVKKFETAAQTQLMYGNLELTDGWSLYLDNGFNNATSQVQNVGANGSSDLRFKTTPNGGSLTTALILSSSQDATFAGDIDLADSKKIKLGDSDDLQIYHDGSHSYIDETGTGSLLIKSGSIYLTGTNAANDLASFVEDGAVSLYYDDSKKFETTSGGATLTGSLTGTGHVYLPDGGKFVSGAGNDLQIYHDGGNSWVKETGTGALYIDTDGAAVKITQGGASENMAVFNKDGAVELYNNNFKTFSTNANGITLWGPEGGDSQIDMYSDEGDDNADHWRIVAGQGGSWFLRNFAPGSWDNMIAASVNAGVELYYDNSKKIETHANGITVTGRLAVSGNSGVGLIHGDSVKAVFGDSDDLQIYHNGTYSFIKNATGSLTLQSPGLIQLLNANASEYYLEAVENGAVSLYHDNSKKLETQGNGITVTGGVYSDGLICGDSDKIELGAGGDLQIYHDGSHSFIDDAGTGSLYITTNGLIVRDVTSNENMIVANGDGAVELYHNNGVRFETTQFGSTVHSYNQSGATYDNAALKVEIHGDCVDDKTMLALINGDGGGDLSQQDSHIDFVFKDSNTNVTPQARISAHVGDGGIADSQAKEGKGWLTFHCSNTGNNSGEENPGERLRIAHDGTFTGSGSSDISDQRLKDNIATVSDPIAKIKALNGRTFTWKSIADMAEGTKYGFIAQEVEAVVPDLVITNTGIRVFDKDDNLVDTLKPPVGGEYAKSVSATGVVPILVEALKEALTKIETLETKVAALEAK